MRKSSLIKIHAAALIFASRGGCSTQELADTLGIPRNSIYHFAKTPEWGQTLDELGYTGDRQFKTQKRGRKPISADVLKMARIIYRDRRKAGKKKSHAVNEVLRGTDIRDRRTVNALIEKLKWEADIDG